MVNTAETYQPKNLKQEPKHKKQIPGTKQPATGNQETGYQW